MCRSKPPKMVVTGSEMKIKLVVGYYLNTKFSKKIKVARFFIQVWSEEYNCINSRLIINHCEFVVQEDIYKM